MFHPRPPGGPYYYQNSPFGPQLRQPFPPPMFHQGPRAPHPGMRPSGLTIVEVESSELDPSRRFSNVPPGDPHRLSSQQQPPRHNPDPGAARTPSLTDSSDTGGPEDTSSGEENPRTNGGQKSGVRRRDVRGSQQSRTVSEMGDQYSSEDLPSNSKVPALKARSWKEVNEDVSNRMRAAATDSPPVLPKRQLSHQSNLTSGDNQGSRLSSVAGGSVRHSVKPSTGAHSGAISTSSDDEDRHSERHPRAVPSSQRRDSTDQASSIGYHNSKPSNMSVLNYDNEQMSFHDGGGSEFMAPSGMHDDEGPGVHGGALVPYGNPHFGAGGYPPHGGRGDFPAFGHPDNGFPMFPPPNSEGLPPFMPPYAGGMMPPPGFPGPQFRGPFPPPGPNMGQRMPPPEMMGQRPTFPPGGPRPPNEMELRMHNDPGVLFTQNGPIIPSNRSVSSDRSRSKKSSKNKHSKKHQQQQLMMKKRSQSMEFLIPNGNGGNRAMMPFNGPGQFGGMQMPPPHLMNGGPPPSQFQGPNDPNIPQFGPRGPGPMMGGPPPGGMFGPPPGMMPNFGGPASYPPHMGPPEGMFGHPMQHHNGMGMPGEDYGYYNGPSIEEIGGDYGNNVMVIGEAPPNAIKTSEILKTGSIGGTLEQQQQQQQQMMQMQTQQGAHSTTVNIGNNNNVLTNGTNNGGSFLGGAKADNSMLTEGDANKLKEKMINEEMRDREIKKSTKKRGACYRVCCESGLTTVIWVVIAIMLVGLILGLVLGLTLV